MMTSCFGVECPVAGICQRYQNRFDWRLERFDLEREKDELCKFWIPTAGDTDEPIDDPESVSVADSDRFDAESSETLMDLLETGLEALKRSQERAQSSVRDAEFAIWCIRAILPKKEENR